MRFILCFVVIITLVSCDKKAKINNEIEKTAINFKLKRFDKDFAATTPETLAETKSTYPVFFPEQFADSVWINKLQDSLQQELFQEVEKVFPDNSFIENELYSLFQHVKYYFPEFNSPKIYTTTSDWDYQNKVIYADTILVIGLDTYLGADHFFYEGIPYYIAQNLTKEQMAPDVAAQIAKQLVPPPKKRDFLSAMVYFGKILYLKDVWLPASTDAQKIGYTEDDLSWSEANEEFIWRNFIENEYLFSTNPKLRARFINKAPFSKFYLEIDNDSPGMIGRYIGWHIVRSFMEKTNTPIKKMLVMDEEKLFKESKYKPKKQ